jgi:D-galactarolactone cycloisomerase
MQITGVTQYHLAHELDGSFDPTWVPGYPQGTHECELFEIETDAGITGITASPSIPGGFEYGDTLRLLLLGEDPHDVARIRRKLASLDLLGPRPWHIEVALWDIIGKDAGKPIHEVLGATSREIAAYASTGEVKPADERIGYIEDRLDEGFEAVKLRITSREDIDIVRQVRETFPDLTLMVDANKGWAIRAIEEEKQWSFAEALAVARDLESLDIAWLEEPLPRHDYRGYARLRERTDVPIAGGEFADGPHEVRELLHHDAVDVLQPDAMLATGIQEAVSIAASAREQGVEYVPHTWTNGVGFAANLHVMTAARSGWCEFPIEPTWTPAVRDFFLAETFEVENGSIEVPTEPGLGIEIDWGVVEEASSADD